MKGIRSVPPKPTATSRPFPLLLILLAATTALLAVAAATAFHPPAAALCMSLATHAAARLTSTRQHLTTRLFTRTFNSSMAAPAPASSSASAAAGSLQSRVVVKSVPAIETSEGVGARVRRSIGTPGLQNLSPFLMLDHFRIPPGAGFADHPHRGQITVTLMLEGEVSHEDSKGHAGTIGPGSLQWMTAAKGIVHAEMPRHYDENGKRLPDPVGLQLWLDLPKENKYDEPDYQEMDGSSLPTVTPRESEPVETEGAGWKIKIIAGESHGATSPVRSPEKGQCWYFQIELQPGGRVFQPLPAGFNAFIYSTSGSVKIGGREKVHEKYHTLVLSNAGADSTENGVWIEHAHATASGEPGAEPAQLFLVAGQPLDQEVVQYGPFVLTSKAEVVQTLRDFQLGQNGFEGAPGWRSKIAAGL